MKKTLRLITLAMVAVMLCLCFASCGTSLSGSYEGEVELLGQSYTHTYTFKGSKVELETKVTFLGNVKTTVYEGKYEIKDGEITFTWDNEDDTVKSETKTFEELEDGSIKIGMFTFKKADK